MFLILIYSFWVWYFEEVSFFLIVDAGEGGINGVFDVLDILDEFGVFRFYCFFI